MSISTPGDDDENQDVQLETLPAGLTDEEIRQVRSCTKLNFYIEKLSAQEPDEVRVCTDSEIEEKRIFSKKDISRLVVIAALTRNLDPDRLTITQVVQDQTGNILLLEARCHNEGGDAGEGYQVIGYILKGRHDDGTYQSETTNLQQIFRDNNGETEGSMIVAEYKGNWSFTPK